MKIKINRIIGIAVLLGISSVLYTSCDKDEVVNEKPDCVISAPLSGDSISQDINVIILVDAVDSDGSIAEVRFYIDDISVGSSSSFPYSYEWNTSGISSGVHSIKAIATDNDGETESDEISVLIIEVITGNAPVADFIADQISITEGDTVNFTDMSVNMPISWLWNFGDDSLSTLQNVSHVYTIPGTYTVELTAINAFGTDTHVKTDYIIVNQLPGIPSVQTLTITDITASTATGVGNITDIGGFSITSSGVCWNTTGNPELSDSHSTDGSLIGIFSSSITNLNPETQYFVRAYATNSDGTGYGNELQFTTDAPTAFNINDFTGSYDCDEVGYGVYSVEFIVDVTVSNRIHNLNYWDWAAPGETIYYDFSGDAGQTIVIPSQSFTFGDGVVGSVDGIGTYNINDGSFSCDYNVWYDGTNYPTQHYFTPAGTKILLKSKGNKSELFR